MSFILKVNSYNFDFFADFFSIIIIKGLCLKINYDADIKKEMKSVFEGFYDKRDYLYSTAVKIIYLE